MTENEKGLEKEGIENGAEEAQEASVSLRELVLSAEAALSDLSAEPAVEVPLKDESQTLAAVSWSEETQGLDFVESEAADENVSRLAELARRVAETAAKKEGQSLADVHSDPNFEMEAAEIAEAEETDVEEEGAVAKEASEEPDAAPTEQMELKGVIGEMPQAGEETEDAESDEEEESEPTEFIEQSQLLSIIESLLFASDRPVSLGSIKQIFRGTNIRTKDIKRAIEELASEYASPARGVTLEEINGGYQLRTKSDNAEYLRRLVKTRPFRLSGPALEVLAIVAYKQPITKHQIDEIRGVESGHLLRALMERGLVAFGEKSDLPGKPMTYLTTRKFLETFGLRNIRELPTLREIDELLPEGIGDEEEKETLSDITEKMSNELAATYSEGEEELAKITEQLKAVDTTTEFFEQEKQRERERRDRERAQDIRERLLLGEEVDEKDRRWLERYEAKLQAAESQENGVEAADVAGEASEAAESGECAGVDTASEAPVESPDEKALDADGEDFLVDFTNIDEDVDDDEDDLSALPDWDDDSEKEA